MSESDDQYDWPTMFGLAFGANVGVAEIVAGVAINYYHYTYAWPSDLVLPERGSLSAEAYDAAVEPYYDHLE